MIVFAMASAVLLKLPSRKDMRSASISVRTSITRWKNWPACSCRLS
jgi:hypothetical protein